MIFCPQGQNNSDSACCRCQTEFYNETKLEQRVFCNSIIKSKFERSYFDNFIFYLLIDEVLDYNNIFELVSH